MNLRDIFTVMWKDLREIPRIYGDSRMGMIGLVFPILIVGILLPFQLGRQWLKPVFCLGFGTWFPIIMVFVTVADSFAGERERKTLETLLASRLSDRSILFGKMLTTISFALCFTYPMFIAGITTLNLRNLGGGEFIMFGPRLLAALIVLPLLGAFAASGIGVLVSLRAATVRGAQQALTMSGMLLFFIPTMLLPFLPGDIRGAVFGFFMAGGPAVLVSAAAVLLICIGTAGVIAALKMFQRARLILD